jgi:hypothetical protein
MYPSVPVADMNTQNMGWQPPTAEMVVTQQPPVYVAQAPGRKCVIFASGNSKPINNNYSCKWCSQ